MKIKINNLTWTIIPFIRDKEPFDGQTDFSHMTIRINTAQEIQCVRVTVAHEITHAILDSFGFDSYVKNKFTVEELCNFIACNHDSIHNLTNQILFKIYDTK